MNRSPSLSVIVPVYEQWELVPPLVACLASQTLAHDRFDVWLVDNGSAEFNPPPDLPPNIHVTSCATPGSYAARNHGIQQAGGDWIVFTDSDCRPRSDWLAQLVQTTRNTDPMDVLLAGAVVMFSVDGPGNCYEIYDQIKGIPQRWYVRRGYATTANLAVPAATMRQLGGFDDNRFSGGDAAFGRRARAAGIPLIYRPEAIVAHPARDSWQALKNKARRIKGGQLVAGTRRRRALAWMRTFLPPAVATLRFMRASEHPLRHRLIAVAVQHRLWLVEMREASRLLGRGAPERR